MAARYSLTRWLFSAPCIKSAIVIDEIAIRLALALTVESMASGRRFNTSMTMLVSSRKPLGRSLARALMPIDVRYRY
jgi:hypothetical protein